MVKITEDLVRKRAEHNDCEIFSLEEISLHQQDIEKIEHLDKWCRELKILYLQSNLIGRIENVGRLKKLEYLNLALNNVEKIENLEGCESLKKLDLTVNFVGELTSVESLRSNSFLEEIYLTGNPCIKYEGYRDYVIAALPQLKRLDGQEIEKSERIKAVQKFDDVKMKIINQESEYCEKREVEKEKALEKKDSKENKEEKEEDNEDVKNAEFWNEECDFTPESRKEIQEKLRENREKKSKPMFEKPEMKRQRRFFNNEGHPMNVNEGKIDFTLTESDDDSSFILDVACYKYLDTSLIDVDVQPNYVRVTMKSKILQLVLQEEVTSSNCSAQRSQTTGHLVLTMPKLNPPPKPTPKNANLKSNKDAEKENKETRTTTEKKKEVLEYNPDKTLQKSLANITTENQTRNPGRKKKIIQEESEDPDFEDDPDVPPLI